LAAAYDVFWRAYQSQNEGNYQSTMHNIPGEQMPHASSYFYRSVPGHGQMYVMMTQGRSQETVKVNAQGT